MESRWVEVPKMVEWVARRRKLNEEYREKKEQVEKKQSQMIRLT